MSDTNAALSAAPYVSGGAPTNVLAIISFVTSLVGFGLVGVVTGHISLSQIKRTQEQGRGLALAGVIVGYVGIAAVVITLFFSAIYAFMFFPYFASFGY